MGTSKTWSPDRKTDRIFQKLWHSLLLLYHYTYWFGLTNIQVFKQWLSFQAKGSTALLFYCLTTLNNLNLLVHTNKKKKIGL